PTFSLTPATGEADEAGLEGGSNAGDDSNITTGSFTVGTGNDTLQSLTINGTNVTNGGTVAGEHGTLTVTQGDDGDYTWTYTLDGATTGDNVEDVFDLQATDSDGSATDDALTIDIVDDTPTARDDSTNTAEDTAVTYDVIANDTTGADGATVTAASLADGYGDAGTVASDENGEITFTPAAGYEGEVVIDYTLTDADGDESNAQLTVTVADDS
ncbi:MAG: Ig-like domain-containing protein, partial [Pseudomonadota bacterium]